MRSIRVRSGHSDAATALRHSELLRLWHHSRRNHRLLREWISSRCVDRLLCNEVGQVFRHAPLPVNIIHAYILRAANLLYLWHFVHGEDCFVESEEGDGVGDEHLDHFLLVLVVEVCISYFFFDKFAKLWEGAFQPKLICWRHLVPLPAQSRRLSSISRQNSHLICQVLMLLNPLLSHFSTENLYPRLLNTVHQDLLQFRLFIQLRGILSIPSLFFLYRFECFEVEVSHSICVKCFDYTNIISNRFLKLFFTIVFYFE